MFPYLLTVYYTLKFGIRGRLIALWFGVLAVILSHRLQVKWQNYFLLFWYRQQGGVLVAGPGKENIIYLFKVIYLYIGRLDIWTYSFDFHLNSKLLNEKILSDPFSITNGMWFKDIQAGDEPDMDELVAACRK